MTIYHIIEIGTLLEAIWEGFLIYGKNESEMRVGDEPRNINKQGRRQDIYGTTKKNTSNIVTQYHFF